MILNGTARYVKFRVNKHSVLKYSMKDFLNLPKIAHLLTVVNTLSANVVGVKEIGEKS